MQLGQLIDKRTTGVNQQAKDKAHFVDERMSSEDASHSHLTVPIGGHLPRGLYPIQPAR